MNDVIKAILEHKYRDKQMKRQVFIARRTRNKRIQNKAFTKLFNAFMKENPVKAVAKIEMKNGKYIAVLNRFETDDSRIKQKSA